MTYVAERLRAIHRDPTQAALDELLTLAISVERMEVALDEFVQTARDDEAAVAAYWERKVS